MKDTHIYQDLVVDGSFTVSGTTTFVNTTNMDVCDNILVLNSVKTSRDSGVLIKKLSGGGKKMLLWDMMNQIMVLYSV